mgnify:FL=1
MNKLEALEANTDGKIVDYVTEAIRSYIETFEELNTRQTDEILRLDKEVEEAKNRIAELEALSNSASQDDKYSLTKAKVVRLMKENGWYD